MTILDAHRQLSEQHPDTIVFFRQVNGDLVTFGEHATILWKLHRDHPLWRSVNQGYWHVQPECAEDTIRRVVQDGWDILITTYLSLPLAVDTDQREVSLPTTKGILVPCMI